MQLRLEPKFSETRNKTPAGIPAGSGIFLKIRSFPKSRTADTGREGKWGGYFRPKPWENTKKIS